MTQTSKHLKYKSIHTNGYAVVGKGFCFQTSIAILKTRKGVPVIRIAEEAFAGNTRIESVEIPEGVTSIGARAFRDCTALHRVLLPSTLETVEAEAFMGCTALTEINLPASLKLLQEGIFEGCTSLQTVNLRQIQEIRRNAFKNCKQLNHVNIESALEIADDAFACCSSLSELKMPNQRCTLSAQAFRDSAIFHTAGLWHDDLLVVDDWIFECKSTSERYNIGHEIKGIVSGAFDLGKHVNRTPNPKYEEQLAEYEMASFMYWSWYEIPGGAQGPHPGDPPKEYFEEQIPLRIHFDGTLAEWENIRIPKSNNKFPVELIAADGSKAISLP